MIEKVLPKESLKPKLDALRVRGRRSFSPTAASISFTSAMSDICRRRGNWAMSWSWASIATRPSGPLKGRNVPSSPRTETADVLAALEAVNFVTIFDEETPFELLDT